VKIANIVESVTDVTPSREVERFLGDGLVKVHIIASFLLCSFH
jgi:hypothetical protein